MRPRDTLFPVAPPPPLPPIPGLSYHPEYINEHLEAAFAQGIDEEPWDTSWERRRQRYGASYGANRNATRPMPNWSNILVTRLQDEGISDRPFDQMVVNEYLPGQGISLHRDHEPFGRTVVSLSLLSSCVMEFRSALDKQLASMLLERRSLIVLSDAARYDWEHGIARRKRDRWGDAVIPRARRISITLRLARR